MTDPLDAINEMPLAVLDKEIPAVRERIHRFRMALGRWFVIWSPIPWPKGKIKAPASFFATSPSPRFEEDREALIEAVGRFEKPDGIAWAESPFLGKLTPRDWAALNARHLDHHLSQFGA